jgi:hypothetical protein
MFTKLAPAALLLGGLMACNADKSDNSAAVKTLDNLTRADRALIENKCGVYLTPASVDKFSAADKAKLARVTAHSTAAALEATGAFMAVPKPIQSLFFASGGMVRVVQDPTSYCKSKGMSPDQNAFQDDASAKIDACWDVYDGKLEVIVRDNEAAVHHSMVRVFGYVYTQYFGDNALAALASNPNAKAAVVRGRLRFKTQRTAIGKALLKDLVKAPADVRKKFNDMAKTQPLQFANFAVTDAIDSYYCSKDTRASFKSEFPATWKAFTEGSLALTTDLGKPID